jgi:hypothetical protein
MKMEQSEFSETSAYKLLTPGNLHRQVDLTAYEDGTDRVFRNVGIQTPDDGESA